MSRLDAPWTQAQVDAINAWQKQPHIHPFTCREHPDYSLHACSSELYCPVPGCTYDQRWVHDFMAKRQPSPPSHEDQGTAYDPGATGYELQGRRRNPETK